VKERVTLQITLLVEKEIIVRSCVIQNFWELGNEKEMSKHITYRTVLYGLDLSTVERIEASGSKFY
jgi:hypothetical protein